MRILVVDDRADNRYLLRALLTSQGFEVMEAGHGAEALQQARQSPPDLVIADLLMPVMDGFALLRQWQADERLRSIPFVVYTATYTDPEDEQLALDLGAAAFVVKPAEPEPFLARLRPLLEEARQRKLRAAWSDAGADPVQLQHRYARTVLRKLEQKCAELEQANRNLEAAREHLTRVLDVLPVAAYLCDAQGRITYVNTRACELWSLDPSVALPRDACIVTARFLRSDGTPLEAADSWMARCLRDASPVLGEELWLERPDGLRRRVVAYAVPLQDRTGQQTGAVGLLWDVTEVHEMAEALRASEERFRRLAESSAAAIFVYAGERFVYVNPATCALTGRTREELLQTRFWEVVHPDHRELVRQRGLARQAGAPVPARYEFKIVQRDGSVRWVDFAAAPVPWEGRPAAIGSAFDITDRKNAEAALQESETRNRIIANLVSDYAYIFRVMPDGQLRGEWVTDSFSKVFGVTIAEIDARGGWQTLVHPEDLPVALEHARKVVSGQRDVCEMRWITPTGQIRWLRDYAEPVWDETGQRVVRIYGASQDITQQRLAELRVARLNRTYAVLSQINQLIVRERQIDALWHGACRIAVETGGFRMACVALLEPPTGQLRLVACGGGDAETRQLLSRIWEDPSLGCTLIQQAITTGRCAVCNDIATDPESRPWREAALKRGYRSMACFPLGQAGQVRAVLNLYSPTEGFFDSEEVQLLEELAQDLSFAWETIEREQARLEAETRLAASEERFRQLAATVEDFFWILDASSGQLLYVSPAFERIWGVPCETLLENPQAWRGFVHPEDVPRLSDLSQLRDARGPIDVQYRIIRPDQQLRWVRTRAYPVSDATGQVARWVGVTRDITREHQLEEQLLQAQKMEAMGRLAGGVAHDFNNILTAILMQLELLVTDETLSETVREGLAQIRAAADRAANLTRQLLLFSRRQILQIRTVDLNESVTALARMLQRIIGEDIRLQLDLHPTPLWLRADPGMLDQVLMNLAVNARDAMPQGGALVIQTGESWVDPTRAAARQVEPGRYACLCVRDEGCGIPAEVLPHIFEPFFTTKEPGKGTGLGLATVYGIVQQHRGWIEVQSIPGQGTTFLIFLPLLGDRPESDPNLPPPRPRGGSETVLLVEDDDSLRCVARTALERYGYRVLEASHATQALELWAQHGPSIDLLLTDLVMPGPIHGRELARRLQCDRPNLKVILFSGYSPELAGRPLELQERQIFLAKPFTPETLLATVRQLLDQPAD